MSAALSKWAGAAGIKVLSEAACEVGSWHLYSGIRNYKRVPSSGWKTLTSKRGKVNFYKGRGVPNTGINSSKGRFTVLPSRSPNYIIPDVRGSLLAPYVDIGVRPPHKVPKAVKQAEQDQSN